MRANYPGFGKQVGARLLRGLPVEGDAGEALASMAYDDAAEALRGIAQDSSAFQDAERQYVDEVTPRRLEMEASQFALPRVRAYLAAVRQWAIMVEGP